MQIDFKSQIEFWARDEKKFYLDSKISKIQATTLSKKKFKINPLFLQVQSLILHILFS